MTLSELRYIVAVARERHFGRAAQTCFVSQPTLSAAVKKLEDELGVQLFERRTRDVMLTPIGKELVARARNVLEEVDGIKQLAIEGRDPLASPLRIGAIYTVGPYLFPELIPELHQLAPETPLVVEEDYTANLYRKLKQGELDAIIIALPFEERGIEIQPLYEEPFVVVLPSSHPLTQQKTIPIGTLEKENVLLLGPGNCFRDQVLEACPGCAETKGNNEAQATLEGGSLETIRYMVASGMGVTVLPSTAVRADRFSERLLAVRRFTGNAPSRIIALAWRTRFPRQQVLKLLQQAVANARISGIKKIEV